MRTSSRNPAITMEQLLEAILDDDQRRVKALLAADCGLATRLIDKARLYESAIVHWIYVGDTALHLAAAGYRGAIVGLLLAAGADPNSARNHRRGGPLHYAADGRINCPRASDAKKQIQTVRRLLDAGAEINAQDQNGATPLHRAVRTRSVGAVRCLLWAGADPMLKNKPGATPFHLAVQDTGHGGVGTVAARVAQRQIIREFLSFGLSTALKDGKGKSVWDCARSEWVRNWLSQNDGEPDR